MGSAWQQPGTRSTQAIDCRWDITILPLIVAMHPAAGRGCKSEWAVIAGKKFELDCRLLLRGLQSYTSCFFLLCLRPLEDMRWIGNICLESSCPGRWTHITLCRSSGNSQATSLPHNKWGLRQSQRIAGWSPQAKRIIKMRNTKMDGGPCCWMFRAGGSQTMVWNASWSFREVEVVLCFYNANIKSTLARTLICTTNASPHSFLY